MDNIQLPQEEESTLLSFDKRILFISLRRKALIIILAAFLATIIGGVYSKLTIKSKWKSSAILIRHKKNMSSQADLPYLYQEMDFNTILQSIKMRRNLEAVIDSLKLDTTPEQLYGTISAKKGNRSNLINISATHADRQTSKNLANQVCETFITSYVNILNSSTQKIYDYYLSQKDFYELKEEEIENQLDAFREKYQVLSLEKETQNRYDNLKELELYLMNSQLNITAMRTKINDLGDRIKDLPDRVALQATVTATTKKELVAMQNQLESLKKRYTPENPKIMKLKGEIEALQQVISNESDDEIVPDQITYGESQFKQSLSLEKAQLENELNSSLQKISDYEIKITEIKTNLKSLSPLEREYYDITNNQATTRIHLEKIENRLVEAKISMDSNVSDFAILERAIPPRYPEASGRKIIALVAGFLTFLALLLYFAGKEFLDFSIKSDHDFNKILKIKLLGEIPNKGSVPPPIFYSQIQILYGRLMESFGSNRPAIMSVGNDVPQTGSTFVIEEVVELMLSQHKKVLWIESLPEAVEDIEKFVINKALYQDEKYDSSHTNQITDLLHKAYFITDDLTFKKVLDKTQVTAFFNELADYDVIIWELFHVHFNLQLFKTIVDSTQLLTFVARFRHSNRTQLSNAVQFLQESTKVPISGILNDIEKPYFKSQL